MPQTIGDRLRKARTHAKMTQVQLAKAVGAKQGAISDLENGRNSSSTKLVEMAKATGVNAEWLSSGEGEMLAMEGDNFRTVPLKQLRMAPVLNYVQAGAFCEYHDDAISDEFEPVNSDEYGECVYWVLIEGKSMEPDFYEGEMVLIDPDIQPIPGDFVVALKEGEKKVTFKKWRPRGFDESKGVEYAQLVPSNEDYPIIDSRYTPFEVCGVAVERKQKLRRNRNTI